MRARPAQETAITRLSFWVFLSFLPLYILVTRGHFQSTDEIAVFQQARSMWDRGALDVAPMINTHRGREGHYYAVYGAGQSIVAAPLYAIGKWLDGAVAHDNKWRTTFGGPVVGPDPAARWGGDVPIFTIQLFNAFVMAAFCALFFAAAMQFGASLQAALVGVAFFGLSSHLAGYVSTFFQHPLEAFLVFATFYLLVRDAREPSATRRLLAGALAGFGLIVRIQTVILLPALSLFLLWNVWQRTCRGNGLERRSLTQLVAQSAGFFAMIAVAIVAQFWINHAKFATYTFTGAYAAEGGKFESSLLRALHGFFFSPGESMFVFTPLFVLMPLYWPPFYKRYRAEALCMLGVAVSYIAFFAKYNFWHGQWCFGPRYILATVPFLLFPVALWWDAASPRVRALALSLAAIGVFVQVLSVSVNFSYVYHFEKYLSYKPQYAYLFIPEVSQPATHYSALMAGDHRVDMWLVNVYRAFGMSQLLKVALPVVALWVLALWGLTRSIHSSRRGDAGESGRAVLDREDVRSIEGDGLRVGAGSTE